MAAQRCGILELDNRIFSSERHRKAICGVALPAASGFNTTPYWLHTLVVHLSTLSFNDLAARGASPPFAFDRVRRSTTIYNPNPSNPS